MGLALRDLESNPKRLHPLRTKILEAHGTNGLHIAEFVQNGHLSQFVGIELSRKKSDVDISQAIETLLSEIDKYAVFVQGADNVKNKVNELTIRIHANRPNNLVICASGNAKNRGQEIAEGVKKSIQDSYNMIKTSDDEARKDMYVFSKKQ